MARNGLGLTAISAEGAEKPISGAEVVNPRWAYTAGAVVKIPSAATNWSTLPNRSDYMTATA